jgi:hypothetical protein
MWLVSEQGDAAVLRLYVWIFNDHERNGGSAAFSAAKKLSGAGRGIKRNGVRK